MSKTVTGDSPFASIRGKEILVIGDLMVDRYMWGTVTRQSPEAPVPVVEITDTK
jgi:bifunctional ADP-heptose synthase (sugar kinase/adenylyltransferase)